MHIYIFFSTGNHYKLVCIIKYLVILNLHPLRTALLEFAFICKKKTCYLCISSISHTSRSYVRPNATRYNTFLNVESLFRRSLYCPFCLFT